jgi:protocatechuate 3,4-dioxygenase beta subunit
MTLTARRSLVVAVLLAVAVVVAWTLRGPSDSVPPPSDAPRAQLGAAAPALPSEAPLAVAAAPTPAPSASADTAPPEPQRVAAPTALAKQATLRGRCVDPSGAPLAGCTVGLSGWGANSLRMDEWMRDHAEAPAWQAPPAVTTDGDGRFAFTFWPPPPFQFALSVRRDGRGGMSGRWRTLAEGSTTDVGDVVMAPGVLVTGRVVDASGAPMAKAYVTLARRFDPPNEFDRVGPNLGAQVVSGPDGTFAVRNCLPAGEYDVRTNHLVLQSPKQVTLVVDRPTEQITVVVASPPAVATIRGRVLDETGAPVRDVQIEDRAGSTNTYSKKDGTFELRQRDEPPGRSKIAVLTVVADDFEVDEASARREVPWGSVDVELRVVRAPALTLRVTDAAAAPVEAFAVYLLPSDRGGWTPLAPRPRAQGKHADGTVVVPGLTRGDWVLVVDFPASTGFESLYVTFRQEGGPRRMDLRALPAARRTVRVVATDDTPIAGAVVQLCDPFGAPLDERRMLLRRDLWRMNRNATNALVLSEGTTGADGRVEVRGPGDRELALYAPGPGHVPQRQSGIRLDAGGEIVLRVSRGARLVGKIVPPEAVAELRRLANGVASDAFPVAWRPRLSLSAEQWRRFPGNEVGADELAALRIADDGTFDATGLPPGQWQVEVTAWIRNDHSASTRAFRGAALQLADDVTTTQDLDLSFVLPGALEGLVFLNGQPFASGAVHLMGAGEQTNAKTDAEGRFRADLIAGEYRVHAYKETPSGQWVSLPCPTVVHVVRGQTTTQTFAIATAALRITVLGATGKPVEGVAVYLLSAGEGTRLTPTDAAGVTVTEVVPDTLTLRVLPKALAEPHAQQALWREANARGDSDPLAAHWLTLRTIEAVAGPPIAVEVQLPAAAGY